MHSNNQSNISDLNDFRYDNELVSYYIMGIAGTITASLGILGNVVSLLIFCRRYRIWMTTDIYLTGLTVYDTLVLVFFIFVALKDTRRPHHGLAQWQMWQEAHFVPRVFPSCHALLLIFQVSSIWLTTVIATERYFMICYPFRAEVVCTSKVAYINTILVLLLSLVYNLPRFFEHMLWSVDWVQSVTLVNSTALFLNFTASGQQPTVTKLIWYDLSSFGKSPSFRIWYLLYSWIILVFLGPVLTIVVVNLLLLREIRIVNRRAITCCVPLRDSVRNHDTNMMLIGVIGFFLLTQVPASVSHFIWAYLSGDSFQRWHLIVNEVGNYLVILNSAINIVPYLTLSMRFRHEFMKLVTCLAGVANSYSYSDHLRTPSGRTKKHSSRRKTVRSQNNEQTLILKDI